jgi:hypothetical protein
LSARGPNLECGRPNLECDKVDDLVCARPNPSEVQYCLARWLGATSHGARQESGEQSRNAMHSDIDASLR